MNMCDVEKTCGGYPPPSDRERRMVKILADHYCGVYFVRTVEGFVHNMNGPMQILWIRSEQVQQDMEQLQKALQGLGETEAGDVADRMKNRIDSLLKSLDELNVNLSFLTKEIVARQRSEVGQVNVNDVIKDTLFLLKADMFFKHRVRVSPRLGDALPSIHGRHTNFCVIVLNLIQNALEAMNDSETKDVTVETEHQDDTILIRVRDTGSGISKEDGPHIFEPFFTTKDQTDYNGTIREHAGLGLSLVSLLLEECQGRVSFESGSGGTLFTVEIPCSVQQ